MTKWMWIEQELSPLSKCQARNRTSPNQISPSPCHNLHLLSKDLPDDSGFKTWNPMAEGETNSWDPCGRVEVGNQLLEPLWHKMEETNSWSPCARSGEPTPPSCPLTPLHTVACMGPHTINKRKRRKKRKEKKNTTFITKQPSLCLPPYQPPPAPKGSCHFAPLIE